MRDTSGVTIRDWIVGLLLALTAAPVAVWASTSITPSSGPAPGCPEGFANVGILANRRVCQLSGAITGNRVLALLPGVVYSLFGQVDIGIDLGPDPANPRPGGQQGILTIEPGVVVFGSTPTDYLVVNRGSQIFAEGTAMQPVILTSRSNLEGSTGPDSVGEWGGLVILGRAPINRCIGSGIPGGTLNCESAVDGMTSRFFGGGSAADNSGRLAYLQVRFAGRQISPGNEINGITFAGVGSSTWARHIQVHNSLDDGIQWFGGRVNHKYLVVTGAAEDLLHIEFGHKGLFQYVLGIQRSSAGARVLNVNIAGEDTLTPRTHPKISNATFIHRRPPASLWIKGGADFGLANAILDVPGRTCLEIDGGFTVAPADPSLDKAGPPVFRSILFGCPQVADAQSSVPTGTIAGLIQVPGFNNQLWPISFTMTNLFLPGPNETGAVAIDPRALFTGTGTFFDQTNYVGTFRDANDAWHVGWTCGLGAEAVPCHVSPFESGVLLSDGFE
jgi:hypothetical protein